VQLRYRDVVLSEVEARPPQSPFAKLSADADIFAQRLCSVALEDRSSFDELRMTSEFFLLLTAVAD
jgi:hypothetical protein